jgi:hypothetical protein
LLVDIITRRPYFDTKNWQQRRHPRHSIRRVRRGDREGTDKKTATKKQRKMGNGRLKKYERRENGENRRPRGIFCLGALVTRFAVLFTAGGPAGEFADEKDDKEAKRCG